MKKLSDYRIKEVNGNFIIETKIEFETGMFKRKTQIEWVNACHDGSPFINFGITYKSSAYYDYYQDNHEIKYKSLDDAKAKIVEWCEDPKYHFLYKHQNKIITYCYEYMIDAINNQISDIFCCNKNKETTN